MSSILLVEDDQALSEVYSHALRAKGWQVTVADSVEGALARLTQRKPNLIILDIILGKQNGFQFLKRLRREPATMDIPVLIVTGLQTSELGLKEELRVSLGVVGVYTKSQISLRQLTDIVGLALNKS